MTAELSTLDWAIIAGYLCLALVVGAVVSRRASRGLDAYFVADRSLPWWWAGTSIAATMFAADTPLAVTGIIARDGLGGNWFWLSWAVLHVAVACFFADRWHRSGVLTDAGLVTLRYSGRWARRLRLLKALLYGVGVNAIILGWVLRAMGTIAEPYVNWQEWAPGLVSVAAALLPEGSSLGEPGQAITVFLLVGLVGVYSTMGGIRGVILTDLVQFAMAMIGMIAFAFVTVDAVGGLGALAESVTAVPGRSDPLSLAPPIADGFGPITAVAGLLTVVYFLVQSVANNPADGGGFFMQRLASCRSSVDARRATGLFLVWNYLVRPWPWFVIGLCALVLIPLGQETAVFDGAAAGVAESRESAFAVLIAVLLPAGLKGVLLVALLAAFMSTVDTHINWGASYLASDVYELLRPQASEQERIRVSRGAVALLALLAVVAAVHIGSIEEAWKTLAAIGAGLAAPTALRWLWWRVNATAEFASIIAGLLTWGVLAWSDAGIAYEVQLIVIGGVGVVACVVASFVGAATDAETLEAFQRRLSPLGRWPALEGSAEWKPGRALRARLIPFFFLLGAVYATLFGVRDLLFADVLRGGLLSALGVLLALLGWRRLERISG